ncbi:WxL domain-containing protein [Enterococcus sp. 669A]|uniref:WxL domain-containing protein n=1 Tax=Candidatus Enterococcus moelleringii TaxID=2815325 RepID=A0ABS3L5X3_9ENTE|nr:WxL domain-containing protein [Enterococcus sp. 669A]MBO1305024.1 WxL domain-containing protein [Enterococcus sp. 669A]
MKGRLPAAVLCIGCLGFLMVFPAKDAAFAQVNSEGEITLGENNRVTEPKEPTNPAKPRPGDSYHRPTNEKGPLSLDVVPLGFYFGTQKMYHAAHTYQANGTDNHLQYLQVTDNRDATVNGWSLKVRQADYLRDSQTDYELTGATLYLPQGQPRNQNNLAGSAANADSLLTASVPVTDQEVTIFSAPNRENAGKATSTNFWQANDVTLSIPRDTVQPGNYSTKIYWILTDGGPSN